MKIVDLQKIEEGKKHEDKTSNANDEVLDELLKYI